MKWLDIVSSNEFPRTRWKKQQKVDEDALLNLNNDISSMQNELSSFQILSEDKQRMLETEYEAVSEKTSELGQLLSSIDNIYHQCDMASTSSKCDDNESVIKNTVVTVNEPTGKAIKITNETIHEAIGNLSCIAEYIADYSDIAHSNETFRESSA